MRLVRAVRELLAVIVEWLHGESLAGLLVAWWEVSTARVAVE